MDQSNIIFFLHIVLKIFSGVCIHRYIYSCSLEVIRSSLQEGAYSLNPGVKLGDLLAHPSQNPQRNRPLTQSFISSSTSSALYSAATSVHFPMKDAFRRHPKKNKKNLFTLTAVPSKATHPTRTDIQAWKTWRTLPYSRCREKLLGCLVGYCGARFT
jgi:hypothetical protein